MQIDILTLFPEMYEGFLSCSIIKRAIEKELVNINIVNFRDYTNDSHNKVDDTPYGGGSGMVLMVEPLYNAVKALRKEDSKVILLTPSGNKYNQKLAYKLTEEKHLIIICGHYEGFDERIRSFIDLELSIGDYILTGGELASMVVTDSITRLIEGVIDKDSSREESFNIETNLLDYPTYTKPRSFMGMDVPEVLLSGNHQKIATYRKEESLKRTREKRPDLLER